MAPSRLKLLALNGYGPVEGDVSTMLTALQGLDRSRFEIFVVSKPRGEVYERLKRIPDLTLIPMELGGSEAPAPGRMKKGQRLVDSLIAIRNVSALIRKRKIDVLYVNDRGVTPQIAMVASRLTKTPFVLNGAYPFYFMAGRATKRVLRRAARLHVHSRYLFDHWKTYAASPDRLTILPYGLDLEKYDLSLDGTATRRHFGIEAGQPIIAMAGRLDLYKGQDDLIKAAAIVVKTRPDAQFLIAGRGDAELKQALEDLIVGLKVEANVRLAGYVPSIPDLLAAANVVAMPSWEEPFGLVALEGMAMAKPVVSTRAGGVPEFAVHEEAALLVSPRNPEELAQAILALISDPDLAERMGRRGRERVESYYTLSQYIAALSAVLEEAA